MIEGLSHMTFIVRDLDRMKHILEVVFDAREVYSSGTDMFSISAEKFFLVGDIWIAIMQGDALPSRTYNHIAFKISDDAIDTYLDRITGLGLSVKPPRQRVDGEGRSIYFHDEDNHLFELHSGTLSERLARYSNEMELRP